MGDQENGVVTNRTPASQGNMGNGELPISQAVLDSFPMPTAVFDLHGTIRALNRHFEQALGLSAAAMLDRYNLLADPYAQENGSAEVFRAALAGEVVRMPLIPFDVQANGYQSYASKEAHQGWLEPTYFPIYTAQGAISHVMVFCPDVTERVEAEQRRAAQDEELRLFKTMVDSAPDGVTFADLEARLSYSNPAFGALTGYGDAVVGKTIFELYVEDAAYLGTAAQQVVETGFWKGNLTYRRADGSHVPAEVTVFLIRNAEGGPAGFAAFASDISEKQAREQRLRVFEALVENSSDGIVFADLTPQVIYANAAFKALTRRSDTTGLRMEDVYADDPLYLHTAAQSVQAQGYYRGEVTIRQPDGTRNPAEVSTFLMRDANEQVMGFGAFIRDIRERKQAEAERATLQEQVIQAQQAALRELSSPLIPIAEGVLIMPLIGSVDSNRAQQVLEVLLDGVAQQEAHTAILDITGVPIVDTQVANALVRAAQAVKLLGASVILTGIRPEVAQTLVGLGVDLQHIVKHGTLQSGVAHALQSIR